MKFFNLHRTLTIALSAIVIVVVTTSCEKADDLYSDSGAPAIVDNSTNKIISIQPEQWTKGIESGYEATLITDIGLQIAGESQINV